jgi:hypothetical protein
MTYAIRFLTVLGQYVLIAAAYGFCVGVAAGAVPGVLASAAILALILLGDANRGTQSPQI